MRTYLFMFVTAMLAPSCQSIECGEGTIERGGKCEPADETVSQAKCGPFTMQDGDSCVPMFDPTICDPATTTPEVDPATGVTTCIGTGGGGCDAVFPCAMPSDSSHQTICGQLYDLKTGDKFQSTTPMGTKCTAVTPDGPCSLGLNAFDAVDFATNPTTATKLAHGPIYLDDCGRYRVPDIAVPTGPFIGLGIDDDDSAGKMGPAGTTNSVGIATTKSPGTATKDLDGYIVTKTTTDMWESSGGPPLSGGIFAAIFYDHKTGRTGKAGVTFTKSGNPITANDYYFQAADTVRTTVDTAATATGANGTALITGAKASDGLAFSGSPAPDATCHWSSSAGASLANIVFVQVFRPIDIPLGSTCDL